MDTRIKQLSYSSRLTLHACPRKYQLYKLNLKPEISEDITGSVTLAFGSAVGIGIQELLQNKGEDSAIWAMFLEWDTDLLADDTRRGKSLWLAIIAIQKYLSLQSQGFLSDWELVSYQGKPAVELSFIIIFPDGFTYKGYVDAVLKNKYTGEVMVLECKTTSSSVQNAATYKNSAQAVGYSIVLDALFPTLSSYQVKYLVYKTKSQEYEQMDFEKSYLSRALWIKELLLDIEILKMYELEGIYPMHGETCYDFYRECEYLSLCTLATEYLTSPLKPEGEASIQADIENGYQIKLHIQDLIHAQLAKEL